MLSWWMLFFWEGGGRGVPEWRGCMWQVTLERWVLQGHHLQGLQALSFVRCGMYALPRRMSPAVGAAAETSAARTRATMEGGGWIMEAPGSSWHWLAMLPRPACLQTWAWTACVAL
jgi:hypothetical protein